MPIIVAAVIVDGGHERAERARDVYLDLILKFCDFCLYYKGFCFRFTGFHRFSQVFTGLWRIVLIIVLIIAVIIVIIVFS